MRKYESNKPNPRPESQYSITTKKKSLFNQIPSILLKGLCHGTPKSSLQFRSQEKEVLFNSNKYDSNIVKSSTKIPKNPYQKTEKKDKQNKLRTKKCPKKIQKQQIKLEEKKILSNKLKPVFQASQLKNVNSQPKKQEASKKLNSLVTQYQQKSLATKTTPLKLQLINKKLKLPYYLSTLINAFSSDSTPFQQLVKSHLITSLQLLQYTKRVSKPNFLKPSVRLPKSAKNTIVFDLDQTLIHCNQNTENKPYDIALDIQFPNGDLAQAKLNIRPYAKQCLQELSQYFEIIIFTASHSCYANAVINYLDPQSKYISHRYFRQSCYHTPQGMFVKDLRIIDRPMNNMLLVDNAAYSYCFQIQNGIPIVPFYDNKSDTELKSLTSYLKMFALSMNMKSEHCKILKTDKFIKYTDPKTLMTQLYSDYIY